ncbi:transmembrane protein [Citrus sinensis]|uniref:Transmembrane protein n=1 Tax=Citrus sinensis TaxID=2711 RepID=A0ACB8I1F8_CITSI|nr:transmembrane protein [Citrus sinensis]
MANEIADQLSIQIGEKLRDQFPIWSGRSIFEVPAYLRNVYQDAYEPNILSIGPYHHGKSRLNAMEEPKIGECNVTRYVTAMRTLGERARKCYAESVSLEQDQFVEMMLLDACFMTELFRKYSTSNLRGDDDPIFNLRCIIKRLRLFLISFKNQLPFFVLHEFFAMTMMPNDTEDFHGMIYSFFGSALPVDFMHLNWQPSPSRMRNNNSKVTADRKYREVIRCATELEEAGIKFMQADGESLFDMKFENGVIKFPRLNIDDDSDPFWRNLIVYEQFSSKDDTLNYVTDYMNLMECLIASPKDVELLCQHRIIKNRIGDDQVIANIFNTIGFFLVLSPESYYSQLRWNRWMAKLRHTYFNNPWALISFLAALFLLLLSFVQTLFTVLPFFEKR